jgi:hypothetical protein
LPLCRPPGSTRSPGRPRVDPGGPTLTKLNALAGAPGPVPALAAAKGSATDVARARGIAQTWLTAVEPAITGFIFSVSKKLTPAQAPSLAFIEDAFHKHFKLILDASKKDAAHPNTKVFNPATDKSFLPAISANFRAIQGVVVNHSKFDLITAATAVADGELGTATYVKATGGNIQVSPTFNSPTRGPNCQAAIVVHEATHVVDGASGADPAHIPEWASNDPPISGKLSWPQKQSSARRVTTCRRPRTRSTTRPPMPRLPPTWRTARTSGSATDARPSRRSAAASQARGLAPRPGIR